MAIILLWCKNLKLKPFETIQIPCETGRVPLDIP